MNEKIPYKIYSATNIKRYNDGLMSANEMYALEKQALEDPLLSDAIEGYSNEHLTNINEDLNWLNENLPNENAKIIPLDNSPKTKIFPWLKFGIAASVITAVIIFGLNYFGKKNNNEIAANTSNKQTENNSTVDAKSTLPENVDTLKTNLQVDNQPNITITNSNANALPQTIKPVFVKPELLKKYYENKIENSSVSSDLSKPESSASPTEIENKIDEKNIVKELEKKSEDQVIANAKSNSKDVVLRGRVAGADAGSVNYDKLKNNAEVTVTAMPSAAKKQVPQANNASIASANNIQNKATNYQFNYKVVDTKGNQIPFTNIKVPTEQIETYSKADGSFGLYSSDSVLNVNVNAAGYYPQNIQLNTNQSNNSIVLKENKTNNENDAVVVTGYSASKSKKSIKPENEFGEVIPADGINNYQIYLANNINTNDKPKGIVELSFTINKNGEPTNIQVVKSLSSTADQEAIRLLENGPKWKSNKRKKSNGKLIVNF